MHETIALLWSAWGDPLALGLDVQVWAAMSTIRCLADAWCHTAPDVGAFPGLALKKKILAKYQEISTDISKQAPQERKWDEFYH